MSRSAGWDMHDFSMSAAAKEQGLGLIVGLNALWGGHGESGETGPYGGRAGVHWTMSPSELIENGSALLANDYPCAVLSWRYEKDDGFVYFERQDIKAAVNQLKELAANQSRGSCSVR